LFFARVGLAQVGDDNPTGTSGRFNGNVTTGCSYDPYTGNATRSVTDLVVAGAVGAYPLAFTRTMNTRYTPGAGTLEFGQAGTWRHNYQWSIDPISFTGWGAYNWMPPSYSVNYPDGRRVLFASGYQGNDPYYRGPPGVSDRFQQLADPNGGDVYLLLSDGGKVWFHVDVWREPLYDGGPIVSTFTSHFMGLIDPYGRVTTVTYPNDHSMTITEPRGRWIKLSYITTPWNGDTVLDTVSASDGRSVRYNYSGYTTENGTVYTLLGNVVYFGDYSILAIYAYQDDNVDPNGRPLIQWAIDPMYEGPMWAIGYTFVPGSAGGVYGQIQNENYLDPSTGDMGVAVSTLSISGNSRSETRGDSPSRSFNYSGARLLNYTDFKGQTSYLGYDGNGYSASSTNARGYTTSTTREPRIGALTVLTHPGDNSTSSFGYTDGTNPYYLSYRTDERGKTTWFTRNGNHEVERIDYPNGAYETFAYNEFGQLYSHRMTSGGIETFYLDGRGMMWASSNPDGTTYYYYYGDDRLEHVTDARSNSTWFQYNARGQVTRTTHADGTFVQFDYDNHGDRISTTDELGHSTTFGYDDYKRLVSMTNPLNQTTTYDYHPTNGDWNATPYVHATSSLRTTRSPMGKYTSFAYDPNLQRAGLWQADWSGDVAHTGYDYDPAGNLTWVQDPRGNVITFGFDPRDRRDIMTVAGLNQTTSWQHDAADNLTRETRPDQSYSRAEFDSMNRVIDTYGFANEHTHYDRDAAGNVWQLIDAKGASYTFAYDPMNRKTSETFPSDAYGANRTELFWYDAVGDLTQYKNPDDKYRHSNYDNRNRPWDSWWDGGVGPTISTRFDAAGRLSSVMTNGGETTVTFGYDDVNRQVWEEQTLSGYTTRRVETGRDDDGNRAYLHFPGWYLIRYDYTQRNQLAHIYGGGWEPWFNYTYDAAGNMTKRQDVMWNVNDSTNVVDGNGVNQYDALNRPIMWENTGGGDGAFARSWQQYDNLRRLTATWRDEQVGKGEKFWFTADNQVSVVEYNADQVWTGNPQNWNRWVGYTYTPDTLNRSSVNDNGNFTNYYSVSSINQYTNINGAGPGYDGNFNLTGFNGFGAAFNSANQMTSASNNGNNTQFTYDGLGRCLKRTVNGATTIIAYDGWKPTVEWDGNGNLLAWNIYGSGPDEILWRYQSGVDHLRYHYDARGNVAFVLGGGGQGYERYTYDAFGQPTITDWDGNVRSQSAIGNRFMFQGREWIAELGIYDFRNRMYHPQLGRFLQKDPLGFDGGDANLFRYCGGDPINLSDPFGWDPTPTPTPGFFGRLFWGGVNQWWDRGMQKGGFAAPTPNYGNPNLKIVVDALNPSPTAPGAEVTAAPAVEQYGPYQSEPLVEREGGYYNTNGTQIRYLTVGIAGGYWSYANYDARHEASMAASNFSSLMAPFWDPGNPNNTGTTTDAGHTIFYANAGTPMGRFDPTEGVVVQSENTFGGGQRDPRWVFPSQSESDRLRLSFSAQKYNDWLTAHNQWANGGR
jgi:RHS repeat-associated protein